MGKINVILTLEKRDAISGNLIERISQPSRSWTRHFFDLLYEEVGDVVNTLSNINDITSTGRTLGNTANSNNCFPNLMIGCPPGNVTAMIPAVGDSSRQMWCNNTPYAGDSFGLVIGTGNTAVTPTDDKLVTKIAHGEGAGQLLYSGTEVYGLTFANPNGSFNIRRYFTNVAGGNITMQECGLYSPGVTGTSAYIYCICRDVFGAVSVANGQILSVVYTVSITV